MKNYSVKQLLNLVPIEAFNDFSTFGAISDSSILNILSGSRILSLDTGDFVFHAGERSEQFYVVIGGRVELYRGAGSESVRVGAFGPGEQFGFASMIALHERRNNGIATSESIVLDVPSDLFFRLHLEAPQDFGILMLNIARELARSLERRDDIIFELGHG